MSNRPPASELSPAPSVVGVEACSLNGDDLAERLPELQSVLGRSTAAHRVGDKLSFRLPRDSEAQLRDLARRERRCCGFWVFDIEADSSEIIFTVAVAAERFSHFIDALEQLAGLPSAQSR